ncbi:MAG: RDD family protein [Bacteroidota bacterium]
MNTIIIPTTQNIELEYPIASMGDRILGFVIDLLIQIGYFLAWGLLFYLTDTDFGEFTIGVQVFLYLPVFFYHLFCELLFEGQSIGKRVMKTRVVMLDGSPPSVSSYVIRWMLRLVDMPFYGIVAIMSIAISGKGQRLGDLAAGTTVVKLKLVTSFDQTIFVETEEQYEVVFPEIKTLSDKDVSILKEVLDVGLQSNNPALVKRLADKVKEVIGVTTETDDETFLRTILKDYNHVYGRV